MATAKLFFFFILLKSSSNSHWVNCTLYFLIYQKLIKISIKKMESSSFQQYFLFGNHINCNNNFKKFCNESNLCESFYIILFLNPPKRYKNRKILMNFDGFSWLRICRQLSKHLNILLSIQLGSPVS